ncbi:death-on-curing protein [Microbacteriaceae bacterium SG_E_30_P1]|uniref:Death-on-curing protein n=1 Tax=Antiquaquibacter oligotrophicus TaxID=2880260 RepID=A0ABT6KK59_9MICO|nr:type II toxin-antitoxin system death-on-curing family toxin [Antiquaquibacter oligotrophicus]MDH6180366.1 death-on-curing protein [Antiquaquibacter oligotrophicus]UDF13892.1 type II toxin-antitoxin system death-on-curing family toxin [Antiquaquibacter oligotrophicus]
MIYLDLEDLLHIARRTLEAEPVVRDLGLLESAAARPSATLFGKDAYPDLETKAAALTQSIVNNHALVDGNKRLGLATLFTFLGINGARLRWTNDEAYDFIIAISSGAASDVTAMASRIAAAISA